MTAGQLSNRDAALKWAARGFAVFPCEGAGDSAKRPKRMVYWRRESTTDARRIDQWWNRWPDALPAIDCGKSGLLVIDADRHGGPDGVAAWAGLIAEHGDPCAACVTTPSGGQHFYFRNLDPPHGNREGDLPKGINVRGQGGYVIAPEASMPDGRRYELTGDPARTPTIPDWLIELLKAAEKPQEAPRAAKEPVGVNVSDARIRAYSEAAIDRELAKVRGAAAGTWNNTLNEASYALGRMVGAGWISESEASSLLLAASLAARPKKRSEALGTIRSGLRAGRAEPRHMPEGDDEADVRAGTAIVRNLIQGAKAKPLAEVEEEPVTLDEFVFEQDFAIETPSSLIRHLLPRNGLVIDGGQSGAAKTYCEIDMCVALASGQDWFGQPVRERAGVLYIAAEGQSTIERRFVAAKRARRITAPLPIARSKYSSVNLADPAARILLIEQMKLINRLFLKSYGVRLGAAVLDTVSAGYAMREENSNAEIARICGELREIADEADLVLIGVHHFGKNADVGLRGGSAWRANCDHSRIFLADREKSGDAASNRRMILEKNRLGPEGETFGFELVSTSFGCDQYGDEISECHIESVETVKAVRMREPEKQFHNAFVAASMIYVHPDGTPRPHVAAVPLLHVRDEFVARYATGEDSLSKEAQHRARSAWGYARKEAAKTRYCIEKIEGCDWAWPQS
jgi:hypothetical protein